MHVNYITLTQLGLPEITRITTDTLDIDIYIYSYITLHELPLPAYSCTPIHGYSNTLDTVISYLYRCLIYLYACVDCSSIPDAWITTTIIWIIVTCIFLNSC